MVGQLLNLIGDYLPWTPIGRAVNDQRNNAAMMQYRNQLLQRQTQEWNREDEQRQAAQNAFKLGEWSPTPNVPVTPRRDDPNWAAANAKLQQAPIEGMQQVGNIGQFKPDQAALIAGVASAGQFDNAAALATRFAPSQQFTNFQAPNDPLGLGGAGQINPDSGQIVNYQRPYKDETVVGESVTVRPFNVGDTIKYGRVDKQGNLLGWVQDPAGQEVSGPRYKPAPENADPFQGRSMQAQALNMLITGDPSTPQYAAAYAAASKPQVSFDELGRPVFVTPDLSWARKPTAEMPGAAQPAPGQPPSPAPEPGKPTISAGPQVKPVDTPRAVATANMQQATKDAQTARDMFFPGGKFDRSIAATARLPFSKGRDANQAIRRAVEVLLRLRTGAAAPQTEVDNYTAMFSPSILDTDEGAKRKMDQLQQFFEDTKRLAGAGGGSEPQPQGSRIEGDNVILKWNPEKGDFE